MTAAGFCVTGTVTAVAGAGAAGCEGPAATVNATESALMSPVALVTANLAV